MNNTIIKFKIALLACFAMVTLGAQEKVTKVSQSFNVDKDVTIDLNTSHCNVIFDTWNKGEVQIEAFVESDAFSKEELEHIAKGWQLDVDGTTDLVTINTRANHSVSLWHDDKSNHYNEEVQRALKELKFELADLSDMDFNFNFDNLQVVDLPEMPEFPELPEMPELPELPDGVSTIAFDYKAYKKDGDAYLKKWSDTFESKYGKDYAKKMEAWGERFGKEWGEQFGEKMAAWGERFAAKMERKAERIVEGKEKQAELRQKAAEKRFEMEEKREALRETMAEKRAELAEKRAELAKKREAFSKQRNLFSNKSRHSHLKKTIIIRMPKKAKIKVDVRHGELEFASVLDDVQADLSHTIFKATGINGSNTSINAAYAPVYVTNWNLGELNLNHVKQAELKTVKHLVLNCTSSNVKINNVVSSAIIDSNIGDVKILDIADTFTNLNFIFQNSKAFVVMPKNVPYNINYKGNYSYLVHPDNTSNKSDVSSFSKSNSESNKTVTVNAKYSKVIIE